MGDAARRSGSHMEVHRRRSFVGSRSGFLKRGRGGGGCAAGGRGGLPRSGASGSAMRRSAAFAAASASFAQGPYFTRRALQLLLG